MITIDRITFNENDVKSMTEEKFVATYLLFIWKKTPEQDRKKKLSDAYALMTGKKPKGSMTIEG